MISNLYLPRWPPSQVVQLSSSGSHIYCRVSVECVEITVWHLCSLLVLHNNCSVAVNWTLFWRFRPWFLLCHCFGDAFEFANYCERKSQKLDLVFLSAGVSVWWNCFKLMFFHVQFNTSIRTNPYSQVYFCMPFFLIFRAIVWPCLCRGFCYSVVLSAIPVWLFHNTPSNSRLVFFFPHCPVLPHFFAAFNLEWECFEGFILNDEAMEPPSFKSPNISHSFSLQYFHEGHMI